MERASTRRNAAIISGTQALQARFDAEEMEKDREALLRELRITRELLAESLGRGEQRRGAHRAAETRLVARRGRETRIGAIGYSHGFGEVNGEAHGRRMALETLNQQVDFLRAVTANLAEGLIATDHEGRLTFMNATAETLLGWREAEVRGRSAVELIFHGVEDGSPKTKRQCPLLEALRTREPSRFEDDVFTRHDGALMPVSGVVAPLFNGETLTGAVVAFADLRRTREVEERMQAAEREAAERGRQLATVFENAEECLLLFDGMGRVVRGNVAAHRLLAIDLDTSRQATEAIWRALFRGDEQDLPGGEATEDGGNKSKRRHMSARERSRVTVTLHDGRECVLACHGRLRTDASGHLVGAVVFVREVSAVPRAQRERALRADLVEASFWMTTNGVLVFSPIGRLLLVNETGYSLLDVPPEQRHMFLILPREEQLARLSLCDTGVEASVATLDPLGRILRGEVVRSNNDAVYYRVSTTAGDERTIEVSGGPFVGDDGTVTCLVAELRDVTEHRGLADALRRSVAEATQREAELTAVFDTVRDAITLNDQDGRILMANADARRLLGLDADPEAADLPVATRAKRFGVVDAWGRPLAPEQMPLMRVLRPVRPEATAEAEQRIRPVGGPERTLEVMATGIRGADGTITGGIAVFHEISHLRDAERRAVEGARRLEAIFESLSDCVLLYDRDGMVRSLNASARAAFEVLEPSGEEAVPLVERLRRLRICDEHGVPLSLEHQPAVRLLRGESIPADHPLSIVIPGRDGHDRPFRVTGAPLRDGDGGVRGAVLIARAVPPWDGIPRRSVEPGEWTEQHHDSGADTALRLMDDRLSGTLARLRLELDALSRECVAPGAVLRRPRLRAMRAQRHARALQREFDAVLEVAQL